MAIDPARELAVITGASSGIGLQIAAALAQRDFDLAISAADKQRLGWIAHLVAERFPAQSVIRIRANLLPDGPQQLYAAVARVQRPVDTSANSVVLWSRSPTLRIWEKWQ